MPGARWSRSAPVTPRPPHDRLEWVPIARRGRQGGAGNSTPYRRNIHRGGRSGAVGAMQPYAGSPSRRRRGRWRPPTHGADDRWGGRRGLGTLTSSPGVGAVAMGATMIRCGAGAGGNRAVWAGGRAEQRRPPRRRPWVRRRRAGSSQRWASTAEPARSESGPSLGRIDRASERYSGPTAQRSRGRSRRRSQASGKTRR